MVTDAALNEQATGWGPGTFPLGTPERSALWSDLPTSPKFFINAFFINVFFINVDK